MSMEQEENNAQNSKHDELPYPGTRESREVVGENKHTDTAQGHVLDIQMSSSRKHYSTDSQPHVSVEGVIPDDSLPVAYQKEVSEGTEDNREPRSELSSLIGKAILYYCKKCKISSLSLRRIEDHLTEAICCTTEHGAFQKPKESNKYSADQMDHSYANELQHRSADWSRQKDGTDKNDALMVGELARYRCTQCPYVALYSETELSLHAECHKTSGFRTLFTCCLCHAEKTKTRRGRPLGLSADWQKVKTHLARIHRVDFGLSCPVCGLACKSHDQLDKHGRQHRLRCHSCPFLTESRPELDAHVRCHATANTFRCFLCPDQMAPDRFDWHVVYEHLVDEHPGVLRPRNLCQKCGGAFRSSGERDRHYRSCVLKVVCERCNESIPIARLGRHVSETHGDPETNAECDSALSTRHESNVESTDEEIAASHRMAPPVATSDQTLTCHRHRVNFSDKNEMEDHLKTQHSRSYLKKKKYSDFFVDLESINPGEKLTKTDHKLLRDRADNVGDADTTADGGNDETIEPSMRTEIEDTRREKRASPGGRRGSKTRTGVRCKYCYKLFGSRWRLDAHCQRVHTEERMKKVPCAFCGKLFRNQVQRRNHTRQVHEGVKRPPKPSDRSKRYFRCTVCQFATPDKGRLRNHHLAVHQGIMPFTCELCGYRTKEKSDFRRHRLRHLGVKRHRCPYYPYQCLERWVMVNHCSRQHRVELPRISRDTRGGPFSMHHLRRAAAAAAAHSVATTSTATSKNVDQQSEPLGHPEPEIGPDQTESADKVVFAEVSQPTIIISEERNAEAPAYDNVDITEVIVQTGDEGLVDNQIIFIEQPHGEDILQYVLLPCEMDNT